MSSNRRSRRGTGSLLTPLLLLVLAGMYGWDLWQDRARDQLIWLTHHGLTEPTATRAEALAAVRRAVYRAFPGRTPQILGPGSFTLSGSGIGGHVLVSVDLAADGEAYRGLYLLGFGLDVSREEASLILDRLGDRSAPLAAPSEEADGE